MSFMLVIIPVASIAASEDQIKIASFYRMAGLGQLSGEGGVFCISETAWVFDIRKSLRVFSRIVHAAHQSGVQLYVFQVERSDAQSLVVSCPDPAKLEKFLAP